ncbi:hypothetical protein LIN45_15980, partial [Bacillus thuringiensis serovar kurstaki]|nr:hypothetical protein [Bacillus thuringiensis serovar kurstaki]
MQKNIFLIKKDVFGKLPRYLWAVTPILKFSECEGVRWAITARKRGTASISEKNHAKKIRVKKSENISLFQDTYSVFFYTK